LRTDRQCEEDARQLAESEAGRFAAEAAAAGGAINRLTRAQGAAETARGAAEARATAERDRLPEPWADRAGQLTDADRNRLAAELGDLERSGVEAEAQALANDRAVRALREKQVREFNKRLDQVPEDARCAPAEIQDRIEAAQGVEAIADQELTAARIRVESLSQQDRDRKQVAAELDEKGKGSDLHGRLAELLGRKGLQLAIVRNAEREIVELANETLLRVSNGELRLDPPALPEDDDGEAVFDLTVRQAGKPHPIGLAFLSGSQRFRVAVALALAVGRYASRQARPLEAVIIDEGFGCLDRVGRAGMIEELQRLQRPGDLPALLKRIILVSHHEDFADSFPVGYRLSHDSGRTTARRLP
jgi:DNA repair exonuclease SbcCD ATPase subunit